MGYLRKEENGSTIIWDIFICLNKVKKYTYLMLLSSMTFDTKNYESMLSGVSFYDYRNINWNETHLN